MKLRTLLIVATLIIVSCVIAGCALGKKKEQAKIKEDLETVQTLARYAKEANGILGSNVTRRQYAIYIDRSGVKYYIDGQAVGKEEPFVIFFTDEKKIGKVKLKSACRGIWIVIANPESVVYEMVENEKDAGVLTQEIPSIITTTTNPIKKE